ncbi:MAG TPA: RIP metalloprotease RseP [Gammaproteobacteria bacterium]|nr:RIP metalloprotease RseP [Gammaproteobacteria bacterium]
MVDFAWSILAFIVAISVLVAVHEYGHFWVARKLGFKVLTFSIGFGRPLLRWRSGRTTKRDSAGSPGPDAERGPGDDDSVEYRISAIPLGGYVKMLDEREGDVDPAEAHRAFNRRPVPARIAVLAAGPAANFLFAIVAYWVMFVSGVDEITAYVGGVREGSVAAEAGLRADDVIESVGGTPTGTLDQTAVAMFDELLGDGVIELGVVDADGSRREVSLAVGDRVSELTEPDVLFDGLGILLGPQPPDVDEVPAVVGSLIAGQPAERAGFEAGDRIVTIDGERIESWSEMQQYISSRPGESVSVAIQRNGVTREIALTVGADLDEAGATVGRIGIGPPGYISDEVAERFYTVRRHGPIESIGVATAQTWRYSVLSVRFIARMVTGDVSLRNVSGPIMIADYAGDFARAGFNRFLQFLAMISISLGIVNLLPVPILDGGQIVMCTIEGIKGKPLSMRAAIIGQQIGLAMIIALMGFVFYNDIARLMGS